MITDQVQVEQPDTSGTIARPTGVRPGFLALVFIELVLVAFCLLVWTTGHDAWGFAATGVLLSAITHAPFIARRQSVFSLWGLTSFAVTIGAGIRGIAMAAGYPSRSFIDEFFLRGATFEELAPAAAVSVATVAALTLGYFAASTPKVEGRRRPQGPDLLDARSVSERAIVIISLLYAAAGFVGTFLYTRGVGGLSGSISQRRGTVDASGQSSGTFGYYETLAHASTVGAMLLLAYWLLTRKHLGGARLLVLAAMFANAFAINWVTTTRSDLLYVAAAVLMVVAVVRGRLPIVATVVIAMLVLGGIGMLTAARGGQEAGSAFSITYGANSGLLNRNAYDLGKSLLIVEAVPETLPYQNGATIGRFFLAPIPRSMWAEKPVISPGPIIGRTLYGTVNTGVPPGLTGELVWNFGTLPAVALSLVIGLVLGRIQHRSMPSDPNRLFQLLVYAVVVFTLGKNVAGVSVGQAAFSALGSFALLLPLLVLGWLHRSLSRHDVADRRAR